MTARVGWSGSGTADAKKAALRMGVCKTSLVAVTHVFLLARSQITQW